MKYYILLRKVTRNPGAVDYKQLAEGPKVVVLKVGAGANDVLWMIRYAYYAFIVSLPFEAANIGSDSRLFSLSKLVGYVFLIATILQPRLCFKPPPRAFWLFTTYLCVVALMGILQESQFHSEIIAQLFTRTQLLIFFWLSYNLVRYERIGKGTLWALAISCIVLGALQALGITSTSTARLAGRVTAFGSNPNTVAGVLSIGLLALIGIAYGREHSDSKVRLLTWLSFGVLAAAIIRTGSRGALVALVAGFAAFLLKGKSFATKLKVGIIILLGLSFLVWASYSIEAIRVRWERTFFQGDLAGRERIFEEAWGVFQEKPLFGWGPVRHYYELGSRLGLPKRDPHNLYLWVLMEAGVLGAIPFFSGLWLCWHAAWKARNRTQNITPLAMMLCILVINLKGTWLNTKLFWIVLACILASSSYIALPRLRNVFTQQSRMVRHTIAST